MTHEEVFEMAKGYTEKIERLTQDLLEARQLIDKLNNEIKTTRDYHFKSQRMMLEDIHLLGHGVIQQNKEIERLLEEIKLLRNCVEGYANKMNWGQRPQSFNMTIWEKSFDGYDPAQNCLAKIEELKKNDSYSNNK